MKYFKDNNNIVYAYDADGSQDHIIPSEQMPITEVEADKLRSPPPLTEDEIWELIKQERSRRKDGGIKVEVNPGDFKWIHSDVDSRIQQLGLKDKARDLLAAGGVMTDNIVILGQMVEWKTLDGSFVDLTAQLAFDIVTAAGDLDAQAFAIAETHKAAMKASNDPASYDFSGSWPPMFGE